jgi:hypothetical protein
MLLAFLVRRALCGIATNNLNRILSPIPSNLNSEASFSSQIAKYLGEEPRQWPAEDDLLSIGVRSALYRTSRPPQVKFILSRLEWNRDPSEKVDPAQSTIEHIYPQTRSAAWDKYVEGLGYDPDAVSTRTHCIGNLTLTGHNGELGQKSFAAKKTEYANSAYELNRELAGLDNWGIKEIDQRSSLLLTEASRLWSGPPAKQTSAVPAPAIDQADELADALQTVPGDRWVTKDALCDVLALDPDDFEEVLLRVDASLAARVMSADGSIPQWVDESLNHAVREQVLSQGGVLAGKAFADMSVLGADELQSRLQQLGDDDPSAEEMALEGLVP